MLSKGSTVTAIVRSEAQLPAQARGHQLLTTIIAPDGHLALSDAEMAEHLRGCDAVISSLGHNLTFKGLYGAPRQLCTDTVRQICRAAMLLKPKTPFRMIAISTELRSKQGPSGRPAAPSQPEWPRLAGAQDGPGLDLALEAPREGALGRGSGSGSGGFNVGTEGTRWTPLTFPYTPLHPLTPPDIP